MSGIFAKNRRARGRPYTFRLVAHRVAFLECAAPNSGHFRERIGTSAPARKNGKSIAAIRSKKERVGRMGRRPQFDSEMPWSATRLTQFYLFGRRAAYRECIPPNSRDFRDLVDPSALAQKMGNP